METLSKNVETLVVGNRVDLASCPYLKNHPSAGDEYAVVVHKAQETPDSVVIGYEGIDHVCYPIGTSLQVRAPKDVPDPEIKVRPIEKLGEWGTWNISQNLTDRWGWINYHNANKKPLDLLEDDSELLERLLEQMWNETCFVVRKDGQFGILYEVEFYSRESEAHIENNDSEWHAELKPHADVVQAIMDGMKPLAESFPDVLFAVPDEAQICEGRPAAWAFVSDGLLPPDQRQALGEALLAL